MNAKEAREIVNRVDDNEEAVGRFNNLAELGSRYWICKGFLEATKAAEPLLEEIEKLRERLRISFCDCESHGKTLNSSCPNYLALSSSAQVVEKYKKETLGEI